MVSNLVSNWLEGECRGQYPDAVDKPDLRLVLWVRQVAVSTVLCGGSGSQLDVCL